MAWAKMTWLPRLGTNLNKFIKSEETSTSVILTNSPDSVTQNGTPFSAENMNHLEDGIDQAISAAADKVAGYTLSSAGNIMLSGADGKTITDSGKKIGNASGNVPLSNGTKCVNLHCDKLDGYDANPSPTANTIPVLDNNAKFPGSITGDATSIGGAVLSHRWKFLPIGFEYVQRKGQSAPASLFGGGTWSNVSSEYAGHFERVEGGNAAEFGGTQDDAMQDHGHLKHFVVHGGTGGSGIWDGENGAAGPNSRGDVVSSVVNGRVAGETRPLNYTVRIWRLIAY